MQIHLNNQYIIQSLFLIIYTICLPTVNAQENTYQTPNTSIKTETPAKNNIEQYELTLIKANTHFKTKNFNAAITQYKQSISYLSENNKTTQKNIANIYTKIAESYKRLKNKEKTSEFYKMSLDIFSQLDDTKNIARTLKTLAESERHLGNLVAALNYSTHSLKLHSTINDTIGHAKALMGAGIIYRHIGRYEKSLNHVRQANLLYKQINDLNGVVKTSNEMGNIYIKLEQFEQAKYFFQETINSKEDKLSKKTIASALRAMAVINLNDKNYEDALFFAQKAYNLYKIEKDKIKESLAARIIANIYRAQQDYSKAIDFYKISLAIAIEKKHDIYQIKTQIPLAAIMIDDNTDKAIKLLQSSLALAIKVKDNAQILYAYRTLRQAEDFKGNFKRALYYAKKEITFGKIINKEAEENKLVLAKVALHSQKLEIELESLRERTKSDKLELIKKNNEIEISDQARTIHELELKKKQYRGIALTSLLIVCLCLIIFIYRSFIISKKRNKQLYQLASRDHLTNCFNRRTLFKVMEKDLLDPTLNNQYCIIMADIDHFKKVNDTYGHNKGDLVIKGFASILQSCIRQSDTVARYGGEEFCIILNNVSHDKALKIADSMRAKTEKSSFDDIKITSSFGVTSLKYGAKSATELIEQADIALYQSKSLGRNQVTLWEKSFNN